MLEGRSGQGLAAAVRHDRGVAFAGDHEWKGDIDGVQIYSIEQWRFELCVVNHGDQERDDDVDESNTQPPIRVKDGW